MRKVERRAMTGLEVRAAEGQSPKIVGYAAVFNSMSEDLGFREIILPGAFDRALRDGQDVRALVDHNPAMILGRTKAGTLALSVDEKGLLAEIAPPDTSAGRDVVASIRRGDLDGMSFGFQTLSDNWRVQDGQQIRELRDLNLLDVSVVAFPVYTATHVSSRALRHVRAMAGGPPMMDMAAMAKMAALLATICVAADGINVAVDECEELCGISDDFKVGDRVTLADGVEPHMDGASGPGTVKIVNGTSIGVEFDSTPGKVHKWYAVDELKPLDMQGDQALASDQMNRARLRLAGS